MRVLNPCQESVRRFLKRLLRNYKCKGGKNTADTQREHTEGIHSPTATTGDSLITESGNAAGNASGSKDDHKSLSRVLRDCQDELQRLSEKIETKNMHTSRTGALVCAFKQGEVNKTLDNLQKFQHQLVVALFGERVLTVPPPYGRTHEAISEIPEIAGPNAYASIVPCHAS
jgi:hypothetical protein